MLLTTPFFRPFRRASAQLRGFLAVASLVLGFAPRSQAADESVPSGLSPITSLHQVWTLPPQEHDMVHRIEAEAEVVYYDPSWYLLWIRSGGVTTWIDTARKPLPIRTGQLVRIEGGYVPAEGLDADRLRIKILGQAPPQPPVKMSFRDEEIIRKHETDRVVFDAYVNSQKEMDPEHLHLRTIANGRQVEVTIWLEKREAVPDLRQAMVRITGLLVSKRDPTGQITSVDIWVNRSSDVQLVHWIDDDPGFKLAPTPAEAWPGLPADKTVRFVGTVHSKPSGEGFLLRDETGQIEVRSPQQVPYKVGDTVEAIGLPMSSGTERLLIEAISRPAAGGPKRAHPTERGLPKLRLAEQVLELGSDEAARGYPLEISGVVLWSSPSASYFFLADASGSVRVERNISARSPNTGDSVKLKGISGVGGFSPVVLASSWIETGTMNLPEPRRVTLEQALTGVEEAQWIELGGVVREVVRDAAWTRLQLTTLAGDFSALVAEVVEPAKLEGAIVRVRGVCSAVANERRQLVGVELDVPSLEYVEIEEAKPADLFSVPSRSIASLREYSPLQLSNRRVLISGVVLYQAVGRHLFIQDGDDGLMVISRSSLAVKPGDRIEVVGFPGREGGHSVLREAVYRKVGLGAPPTPVPLALGPKLSNAEMDGRLVWVSATVLDSTFRRGTRSLILQAGDAVFEARLDADTDEPLSGVAVGSRISVVGVYRTESDEYRKITGFNLQMRSPEDVFVVRRPSWWTADHLFGLVALFGAALFGGVVWVTALRRRVLEQTRQIRSQLEKEADLEARYREIVENASDFIFTLDDTGGFTSFNPAGERILGYTRDSALAMNIHDLLAPEARKSVLSFVDSPGQKGSTVTQQARFRTRGGQIIWLEISARRAGEHGDSAFILAVGRDVTERKHVEEELKRARDAAEANTRAKSSFLANMSHEIRTPMNGVIGMSNLLLDTPLNRTQREFAETIRNSADALLTVLNDILDFSKIEAGKLAFETLDFDLRETIDETIELLAPRAAGKGLELAAFVPADLPCFLRGDPGRLRQVLLNLLGNAIKFTDKGEVVLHVSHERKTDSAVGLRFEITDTGIGIPSEVQEKLFTPFSQADSSTTRRFGGTGLGLAISSQIVHLMKGDIGVRSRPGLGSTFWFTASFDRQPDRPSRAPLGPAETLGGMRVLVVDDNETNRRIIEHYLNAWNMSTVPVPDGPSALKVLRESGEGGKPFDIAVLDFEMPGMDGVMLAKAIHAELALSHLPLVLCTSWDKTFDRQELKAIGIVHAMLKPVRQAELLTAMLEAAAARRETQLVPEAPAPRMNGASRAPFVPVSPAHILVAEDNAVNQRVTLLQLQKLGYRADVAWTGIDVLECLERSNYDLVLMDCHMPEMDGYEASRRIRQNAKHQKLKIVAMTANAMLGDRERCIAAGMDDYISKPTRLNDLQDVLARTLKTN
ncbi:hypothetical protein DB347_02755 [Opitutaceae bacterium EW11]|nr:hypothetical protein DB347_02755 [Opitutaceae bacterium EW11]